MSGLVNWYVFFVKTGYERKAIEDFQSIFKESEAVPRQLFVESLFKRNGVTKLDKRSIFPGYIFVISSIENYEFIIRSKECIKKSKVILKILCYGDTCQAALRREESAILEELWAEGDCLRVSKGIIIGDRVQIIEGPFAGKESLIKKINYHKMQALIELEIMGAYREVTIGLNIVKRLKTTVNK